MKYNIQLIFFFTLFSLMKTSFVNAEIKTPSESSINQLVFMIAGENKEKMQSQGKIKCQLKWNNFKIDAEEPIGRGQTTSEAIQNLMLQCIKIRCDHLGEHIHQNIQIIGGMDPKDLQVFLQTQGKSKEEIELVISQLNQAPEFKSLTCIDADEKLRTHVYDSCMTTNTVCND